ncbi:archaetidylserine decarboxylase [Marinobacter zhanjiangensis]|uniref:Phosphatidylserine decarboxylase proenzyme n=1 Tax=Marinobacter zhanjiangensis TaxID=578215 RepID=A0ABQ3B2K2_9GAMM|nr:archaetidylserine decarboxylase [Marinobacter zhanjiangensis]GGY75598.1 phosphatidylserine decarboxylase proenzyme [Marinobacter zhanjiangensis]
MLDRLFVLVQYLLPQLLISRLAGKLADARPPSAMKNVVIRWFIGRYGVNMSEAADEDPASYPSFNEFFTRELKPGLRPLADGERTIVSPVDGTVSQLGRIERDRVFQAKGQSFNLTELLGGDDERARPFVDGQFATIYLAPKDYHRIHMPLAGQLREMVYVPGRLFSVNPVTAAAVPGLFARNERVVATFDTEAGPMAMVLVGAMIVGSVETRWAGIVAPTNGRREVSTSDYRHQSPGIRYQRGEEMGRFRLGSTVILVFPKGASHWQEALRNQSVVRLGESIGEITSAPPETPAPH